MRKEVETIRKNQMKLLELKNIFEIKILLDGIDSILDTKKMGKSEGIAKETIQIKAQKRGKCQIR